jgi:hypothetical protein
VSGGQLPPRQVPAAGRSLPQPATPRGSRPPSLGLAAGGRAAAAPAHGKNGRPRPGQALSLWLWACSVAASQLRRPSSFPLGVGSPASKPARPLLTVPRSRAPAAGS